MFITNIVLDILNASKKLDFTIKIEAPEIAQGNNHSTWVFTLRSPDGLLRVFKYTISYQQFHNFTAIEGYSDSIIGVEFNNYSELLK